MAFPHVDGGDVRPGIANRHGVVYIKTTSNPKASAPSIGSSVHPLPSSEVLGRMLWQRLAGSVSAAPFHRARGDEAQQDGGGEDRRDEVGARQPEPIGHGAERDGRR